MQDRAPWIRNENSVSLDDLSDKPIARRISVTSGLDLSQLTSSQAVSGLPLRELPTLFSDPVIIDHGSPADAVFTRQQWFAICAHLRNDNSSNCFLIAYRDECGTPKFSKAFRADARKYIPWAWDTITGKAKKPVSVGFYPTSEEKKTRWGAMDFDSHDGNMERARDLALKAFQILVLQPQLFVALLTSSGDREHSGFHLFIFATEFIACAEWTRFLKQVAAQIGAPIQDGILEIFPDEFSGIGKAIRAPASWNPKTGDCGLVLYENLSKCISHPAHEKEKESIALSVLCEPQGGKKSVHRVEIFRGENNRWRNQFAITAPGTRHKKLTELTGTAYFQAAREVVRKNAELQYQEATPSPKAELKEHLEEFRSAWEGWHRIWLEKLSVAERAKYDNLATDIERDAFRIIRNWSNTGPQKFKIHCQSLADRLGISLRGAGKLRQRFCKAGILRLVEPYVENKFCARFRWTAASEPREDSLHGDKLLGASARPNIAGG